MSILSVIKFTPSGGKITNTVHLNDNGEMVLTISDTGIGIKPENIKRIKEAFWQEEGSYSRHFEGTGLGMAIVTQLTQLHDATMDIQSVLGEGTSVTITFPTDRVVKPSGLSLN